MGQSPRSPFAIASALPRCAARPRAGCVIVGACLWLSAPRANAAEPAAPNACERPDADRYPTDWTPPEASPARAASAPSKVSPRAPKDLPAKPPQATIPSARPRLELSFGSAEKFYNQSLYDPGGFVTRRAIPLSTIRPLVDWLFQRHASVWLAFDLPLEPRSDLQGDRVVLTYVPPSLESGMRFGLVDANVLDEITLGLQVDGGLGWVFSSQSEVRLFPHLGWRLHLWDNSGFTAYLGASYEFRLSIGAIVYGVGHLF